MTDEQKSRELYRIAYQCASVYKHCDHLCNECPYCVLQYTDEKEGMLIMAGAKMDYHREKAEELGYLLGKLIVWGVIILLCLFVWIKCSVSKQPKDVVQHQAISKETEVKVRKIQELADKYLFDLNKDGQINCIDNAVYFCTSWPKSRLILNNHGTMNHLFVSIPDGNRRIYIEPQKVNKVLMEDVWSNYDPRYNEDVTVEWGNKALSWTTNTYGLTQNQIWVMEMIADWMPLRMRGE